MDDNFNHVKHCPTCSCNIEHNKQKLYDSGNHERMEKIIHKSANCKCGECVE